MLSLSAAYAEVGRFPDALEAARRALELSRRKNNTRLTEALSARIALYQANKPVRE